MNLLYEKYQKYIIAFSIGGRKYYCVWGNDLSEKNPTAKLLCDSNNNIIAFESMGELIKAVPPLKKYFFDKNNFIKFVKELSKVNSKRIKVDCVINIDPVYEEIQKMNFSDKFLKNHLFFNGYVTLINLIDDYGIQIKDKSFEALNDKDFNNMWEHYYDMFLWNAPKYNYKNAKIKKTTSSKDKVVLKFELLLLNFSSRLTFLH